MATSDPLPQKITEEDHNFRTALLEAQYEATPDGILVVDSRGKILSYNQRFVEMWQIPQKILGTNDDEAALRYAMKQLADPKGFIKRVKELYKSPKVISHEELVFKDGRVFDRYGALIKNPKGQYYGWAWHFHDITERKKIEERQTFLDKISDALFTSFNDDSTIQKVAQLILTYIADYCRIVTLDEHNNISDIAVNHTNPHKVQLVVDLYDEYKDDLDSTQGVHKILKTGKAELLPVMDKSVFESIKNNPKLVRIVKDIGLKSYMGVPLIVRGKVRGAITFSSVQPKRFYNKSDLAFVKEIGRRIALALDNARLYREADKASRTAESERQRLYDLFMQTPAMISMVQGPNHVYEFANPMYLKVVGKTESIIGQPVAKVFPELKDQAVISILDTVYNTGKPFIGKEVLISLDVENTGTPQNIYFDFVYFPTRNAKGNIDGILVHAIDVTDKVASRKKIELSEERFRILIEKSSDVIALSNREGHYSYVSPGIHKILGYTPKEFLQINGFDLMHPDERQYVGKKFESLLSRPKFSETIKLRGKHKNGSWRWMEATATNLLDDPKIGSIVSNFRDITDRKEAEDKLRESEERARAVFYKAGVPMSLSQPDGSWIDVNKVYPKMFGYSHAQLKNKSFSEITHPDDREADRVNVNLLLKGELKEYIREKRYIHRNGSIVHALIHVTLVRDSLGQPSYIIAVLQDITKRKQAEEMLRESEERLVLAQQAANIGTFEWNIHTGDFMCTTQLEKLYGVTAGAFKNKFENWLKTIYHEDKKRVRTELQTATKGKRLNTEFRIIMPDESLRWIAVRARVFNDKAGKAERLVGINRNVTKRKVAEELLKESEKQFRQLADSMPQMVWTARPDGHLDYYNKQWYDYTGFKQGDTDQSWKSILHPDDEENCSNTWNKSVLTGRPYQIEYRLKDRRKPGTYRWFLGRALPIKDKKGKIIKWFGTCTDVDDTKSTRKRKDELEKITVFLTRQRKQLVELNKAKDEFISIASHQLRTPATGVKMYVGMLLDGFAGSLSQEQESFLRNAYESNERQINVVNDLLRVATVDAGKVVLRKENTDLIALTKSVIEDQASKFAERSQTVLFEPEGKNISAFIDARKLRMVIENIIDNASKYSYPNKTIEVKLTQSKDFINISVKDEGVGISKRNQHKLFRKFSSLDNSLSTLGDGTGIGLYWAKNIVELHNGSIEVDSSPKKGSTFTIKIPVSSTAS